MTQGSLFETPAPQFSDSRLVPTERIRLNRQCVEILKLMVESQGRVSNAQLNTVAFRYSARIYDLRKAGIRISIVDRDHETGVNWYAFENAADRERAKQYLSSTS